LSRKKIQANLKAKNKQIANSAPGLGTLFYFKQTISLNQVVRGEIFSPVKKKIRGKSISEP